MRVKMTVAVAALAALLLGLPASSYAHRTIEVKSGESIQAAIDKAKPYTTIEIAEGTYSEALHIDKDGIELVGDGRKKTNLVPPAGPPTDCVFAPAGICVNNPDHTVKDVEISDLSVKGFVFGIFYFDTEDGEITHVIASDNDGYGIFVNNSTGATISRNVTGNDGEAGIYVGDSPHADATVWKNVAYGSTFGVFIRDAAHGQVLKNKAFGNCAGILFLNTNEAAGGPPGQPPGPSIDVEDWVAQKNNATANNKVCEEGGDEPPVSGIGIGIAGGNDIDLIDNGVYGNTPPEGAPFGGGIVIIGSPEFTPPKPSSNIKVGFNQALGNTPDIQWDGTGSGNKFFANDCLTSQPDGLCEDPDDNGDHGDDGGSNGGDRDHADNHKKDSKKHKSGKHKKHRKHKKSKKHDD